MQRGRTCGSIISRLKWRCNKMPTLALVTASKGNLVYINMLIKGTSYNFIVDTGAEFSILSLDLATNLNLTKVQRIIEMHGVSGSRKTPVFEVEFRLLGKRLRHITVIDFTELCREHGLRI